MSRKMSGMLAILFGASKDPTEAVALEVENFSVTNPTWDRSYLICEAKTAMDDGMPVSRARIIYGADIANSAVLPE